jgi:hypothetical protein
LFELGKSVASGGGIAVGIDEEGADVEFVPMFAGEEGECRENQANDEAEEGKAAICCEG